MGGLGRVLVGRDRELAALARAAERAAVGETQVAIVSGGAGVGKTALLRSAIGSLTDVSTTAPSRLGPVIAAAQGVQLAGGAIPFGITSQLLEDLSGQVRPDWTSELAEERRAELGRLHPAFRIGGEKTARGVLDRLVLTAAWRDLVATVASSRLLVLVVDDLQWVDEGSSDLLASLLSGMANLPVLLLASLRSPTTESSWQVRQVASLVRHPGNTFLDLLPLQEKDVRRFIAMRDEHTLSRTQVCRVVRLAEESLSTSSSSWTRARPKAICQRPSQRSSPPSWPTSRRRPWPFLASVPSKNALSGAVTSRRSLDSPMRSWPAPWLCLFAQDSSTLSVPAAIAFTT